MNFWVRFLLKPPKTSILDRFWDFLGPPEPTELSARSGFVTFLTLWLSNFMQKI